MVVIIEFVPLLANIKAKITVIKTLPLPISVSINFSKILTISLGIFGANKSVKTLAEMFNLENIVKGLTIYT